MKTLLLCAVLLLTGCHSAEKDLNTWIGMHRDDLYRTWGPAHHEATLSNGNHLIGYQYGSQMYVPVGGIIHGIARTCRIQFETDPSGIVTTWSYQGNC